MTTDIDGGATRTRRSGARHAHSRRGSPLPGFRSDKVVFWGEQAGVDRLPPGMSDQRHHRRADRLSIVTRVVTKVQGLVGARVMLLGDDVPPLPAGDGHDNVSQRRFADFDWRSDAPMPDVAITRDDIIQIIFTSGATANRRVSSSATGTCWPTSSRSNGRSSRTRKYGRPFHPIRFLNLLPLSQHVRPGDGDDVPPMLRGTVVFTRSFNPHDIIRLIRARRVSVLVCVPKILHVLREHVMRAIPESAEAPPAGTSIPGRCVEDRRVHRHLARSSGRS